MNRGETVWTHPGYQAWGPVMGPCEHRHRSLRGVMLCLWKHRAECAALGGDTDRVVVRTDGKALAQWEYDQIARLEATAPKTRAKRKRAGVAKYRHLNPRKKKKKHKLI